MSSSEPATLNSEVEGEEDDEDQEELEDWQREAAEQLAKEAEEHERKQKEAEEEERRQQEELKRREKEKGTQALNMPNKVDLSIDEAKALFKVRVFSFNNFYILIHIIYRHSSEKKTSTPSSPGT